LESGRVRRLFDGGTYARYAPTGHLIYLRNGDLLAATFDASTLTVGEERVTVATGVYSDPSLAAGNHALSPSGTLAFVPGDGSHFQRTLTVVNGSSRRPLIEERQYYEWARLSPDGGRVAVMRRAWVDAIYAIDLARGTSTPLTSGAFSAVSPPLWSPDGQRVIVSLWRRDGSYHLVSLASDGSGSEELLRASESRQYPLSFTPDGRTLIFRERRPETGDDLLMLTMADRAVRPLLATPSEESAAAVSPDGRWIAFQSNRSGQMQVHLASFPDLKGVVQVSTAGGSMPVWSRDGRRLYYNRRTFAADVEVVDVGAGTPPRLSRPQSVSQFSSADGAFDLMPDGSLLFVSGSGNDGSTPELRVVVNAFDKLQRRTAGAPE
jgi:serine/threonine-protein kinase